MTKQRDYVRVSTLGSYFGVGFNDAYTQFMIDTGQVEESFDEDSQDRMSLGKHLEKGALDYFEEKLGIIVTDRNEKIIEFFGGRLKGIVDGMAEVNGVKTVIENKISNSKKGNFTENLGYIFQVQAYMFATDTTQALLCGLYQGKPVYKIVPRDDEMIEDIKTMTKFVVDVMNGLESWDKFPEALAFKYSKKKPLKELTTVDEKDKDILNNLFELKRQAGQINNDIKDIEEYFKHEYDPGYIELPNIKVTITEGVYKGGIDTDTLSVDHPELDLNKYKKPDTVYKQVRISKKKATQ